MCAGDLVRSEIEPSRAMYEMLWDPKREEYRREFTYLCSRASFLYTCPECCWWCVRDACDFLDDPERPFVFRLDYLIFAVAQKSEPESSRTISESAQPWLKALDDPDVYDEEMVRNLPDELAALMYKPATSTESSSIRPRTIRNLAEYDPFIDKTRDLIAEKKDGKLRKTEPMWLLPGDKVRVIKQTFGCYHAFAYFRREHNELAIARWNIGTVVSHDVLCESRGVECSVEKEWMDAGLLYPIRLETAILPPAAERTFLETLHKRPYIHGVNYDGVGKICLIDVNFLQRIREDGQGSYSAGAIE
jgi:hypothetical protein